MKLFSKRINGTSLIDNSIYTRDTRGRLISREFRSEENKYLFLKKSLRNRLLEEIKYIILSNYLENFLLIKNKSTFYINKENTKKLLLREGGYEIDEDLICCNFNEKTFNDYYLFDFIEIIIIFSKIEKLEDIRNRFNTIFKEESDEYCIQNFMITKNKGNNVNNLISIIKDDRLKNKLKELYTDFVYSDYQTKARISADLLQFLFSSENGDKNKEYSENLCKEISQKWTYNENIEEMKKLINTMVLNAKNLNNQISNIRHLDKNTIQIINPDFYKTVYYNNLAIIELVIASFPEKYIISSELQELKDEYIKKYSIDNANIEEVIDEEDEINLEDIPF